jgi:serine protease Do
MYNQGEQHVTVVLRGLALALAIHLLGGCGKSPNEIAAEEKARSERATVAAQAELDADQKKFRQLASGELRALSEEATAKEPNSAPIGTKEPALRVEASVAPTVAPRSAENVFVEVAPSVARVQVMDSSGQVIGIGSGVVIDKGIVITNCHVATRGTKLAIKINDSVIPATIQLADEVLDLCRLNVAGLAAPSVVIDSVTSLRTGQRVYAIGAPAGLELTISEGIVSALRRVDDGTVIQTTAPISPGSSGGGLFDMSGHLVGITTFQHRYGQNLNFALPADWIGQMRARRASEATSRAPLAAEWSQDSSLATLILGQWLCRDWISGLAGQYNFESDGSVSIAMTNSRVATVRYKVSGKTLQISDAKKAMTVMIQELTARKMILHGRDQSIACER